MKAVQALRNGDYAYGTMARLINEPGFVQIASRSGLDFLLFDLEHGSLSIERLADLLAVARSLEFTTFVRIPECSKAWVSRVLDAGTDGIMLPMVETEAMAKQFAHWAKYPPDGGRGVATGVGYTAMDGVADPAAYLTDTNRNTLTIAQIETATGVDNVEAIAAVPGIDVLLVGPSDLSTSLGCPQQMDAPELHEAITRVAKAVEDNGKVFGLHAQLPLLKAFVPKGLRMISYNTDVMMVNAAMKALSKECHSVTAEA
jgi:2-keto-3-deoxy-L-rhamnonate aldolase RhmA